MAVTVSKSKITTSNDSSTGIFAQSAGGGGGAGGYSVTWAGSVTGGVSVALGGKGASGGSGDKVNVSHTDTTITTAGYSSSGVYAQSLGGGGGDGGYSIAGSGGFLGAASVALGGSGDGGGNAGNVSVDINSINVTTGGEHAYGILAQSLGGGGGNGGFSVSGALSVDPGSPSVGVGVSLGGSGGIGASANQVNVTSTGATITTAGNQSRGILAQSLGAGGGFGGIKVNKDFGGATSADVSLGASGNGSGNGDSVTITSNGGWILSSGEGSSGLVAQSIGDGGGIGWLRVTGTAQADHASLTLGGQNSCSGSGGSVSIQNFAQISVVGLGSYGILAQSLGGGGGLGSNAALSSGSDIHISGATSASGDGGTVDITNIGSIESIDDGGYGIIAQSIGGGGGLDAVTGDAGSVGGKGSAGDVEVVNSGSIITTGAYSHGIFAQSAGGTGTASLVTVRNNHVITVSGIGAHAIFAACSGQGGPGQITITN